jgi:ABC-type dipeptide/oligopeptide/nickel transport system permease component
VPTLLLILLGVYAIAYFGAGDPIKLMFLRAPGDVAYDPVRIEAIRASAGLDRPFFEQFFSYITNLAQGNWGNSLTSGRPVWRMIAGALPVTLQIGLVTVVITAAIAIPLGTVAALREGKLLDHLILTTALALWAIPPYVAAPVLMVLLITLFPGAVIPVGWFGLFDGRVLLPLAVLAMHPIALITRQTRAAVIEIKGEDFVRTARAKGVPGLVIVIRHIMRPVMTPVVTQLGLITITLVNGALFVELIFGLPGIGNLTVTAMLDSDYPTILAVTLLGALAVMISNLLVDLVYPLLDPRAGQGRAA